MRAERIRSEVELITSRHGPVRVDADLSWLIVDKWPLPPGWSLGATPVAIILPPAYPTTPPDNFYTDRNLRTATEELPSNTSVAGGAPLPPGEWLCFSWHLEAHWRSGANPASGDNLLTFLASVGQRLSEVG